MLKTSRFALSLTLAGLSLLGGCRRAKTMVHHVANSEPDYTAELQNYITPGKMDALKYPDFAEMQGQVESLYDSHDFDLLWVKNDKPTPQAEAMLSEFSGAMKRGLRPQDYDNDRWQAREADLKSADGAALFDVAMTVNAMRFISDLHMGRVPPTHFTFGVKGYDDRKIDASTVVSQMMDGDVSKALDADEPQAQEYAGLKVAMQHYLELVPLDHADALPEIDTKAKLVPLTASYPALGPLAQRLALVGDLPSSDPNAAPDISALTEALKHFQHRHGIAEDGKLGHDVVEQLNTPMTARVTQIADSMERWRWLNDQYQNAAVFVNLPEFVVRTYEGEGADRHEAFRMEVVDGKSDDPTHNTPVIADMMKYLVFRPYWNVPPSIAKKEIIPHMQKQPGYLGAKGYETVDMKGNPAPADMGRIAQGSVMVRQKAGTSNSLGLVKFMFPNPFNVYLHDTNEKALFARTRRDYSHGCVRLQDPVKMANWVLRDNPKWDEDSIAAAMNSGEDNKTVPLTKPIPVVVFYSTAWSDNGEVHFFKDMYGYDADLEKALDGGRPYPTKPMKEVTEKDA